MLVKLPRNWLIFIYNHIAPTLEAGMLPLSSYLAKTDRSLLINLNSEWLSPLLPSLLCLHVLNPTYILRAFRHRSPGRKQIWAGIYLGVEERMRVEEVEPERGSGALNSKGQWRREMPKSSFVIILIPSINDQISQAFSAREYQWGPQGFPKLQGPSSCLRATRFQLQTSKIWGNSFLR